MSYLKKILIPILNRLPYIRTLRRLLDAYREQTAYPPGHYYSPVPDINEVKQDQQRIFKDEKPAAIEIQDKNQVKILEDFLPLVKDFPYKNDVKAKLRYIIPETFFTYTDALVLYCMMRLHKPARIIEVGSGYSTALMLDTNELFFEGKIQITCIDPEVSRLKKLMKNGDEEKCTILRMPVQNCAPSLFASLQENDLLFIDSSHVSKTGSDLNFLFFEILPFLKKGVLIHIHDVYYPFEYTKELVLKEKLAWNEAYLLRAFLMYNQDFEIVYFNNYIYKKHQERLKIIMPEALKDEGASLYIRKIV